MNKIVDRIYWVNDTDPALNETNLNQMDSELDALDDRVLALVGDCEAQAEEAEAWAVGERGGDPVSSGDPTYQNNSKYYAQQASGSATTAGNSATAAGNSALAASGSATTAGNQALVSEGFANGTQNGTPVTSGSPYYENNAKYWKEQAQAIASQSLAGLTDVDINAPADGDILVYDSADSEWKNEGNHAVTVTNNPISITTQSAQVARDTKITLNPIQAAGTPTPSNPLPISGYDSVSLDVTGKNILDFDKYLTDNGITFTKSSNAYAFTTNFALWENHYVFANEDVPVTISGTITNGTSTNVFIELINKNGQIVASIREGIASASGSACELRMNYSTIGTCTVANPQLELASSATTYEPYTPATQITLPLPSTVYGGEVDVERGVMTVDRAIVDMGEMDWNYNSTYQVFLNYMLPKAFNFNVICSAYKTTTDNFAIMSNLCITANSQNNTIYIKDTDYTDANTFKTAVTGQKIVYELATPYEIQLTPYEVNLLQGANVITSNGTSVTLTYREGTIATLEDIPSETVNKLAEMVADVQGDISTLDSTKTDLSAIAPIEDGTTASQAYKVNEYFIRGGKLCKCISAISAGSTFTLNTNYIETTLAKEIPKYTVSTTDITAGTTPLASGQFYIYRS